MRKYYKPCNIRKRDVTSQLTREIEPWDLLSAFMQGAHSLLSDELKALAAEVIHQRSVSRYLDLSKAIDARTQLYPSDVDSSTVWCERQLGALLKKFPFSQSESDLPKDPRVTATEKWLECETICRETNIRLKGADDPSWLSKARALAHEILGELSPSTVMQIISSGTHGPGSTLSSKGNRTSSYYKFADLPYTCTRAALPYAYAAISLDPKWSAAIRSRVELPTIPIEGASPVQVELMYLSRAIEIANEDKITFVPKDCRTDRPIAVGASMNIFLQLGVKRHIEERLRRFGIDLTDQTKNQEYARLGSLYHLRDGQLSSNQFSTIDLESASDTISTELVRKLLPADWFAFLSDLRHAHGLLPDGSIHVYEKFSAMGNGYTFPLESLIFFCICKAATEDSGMPSTPNDITVFGDDIIIRHRAIAPVLEALNWSGFKVNSAKSFLEGPFKESCGCDYINGTEVRPFYLKRRIRTFEDVYFVCNSLLHKFVRSKLKAPWIYSMYDALVSCVPAQLRSYGPMDQDSSYLNVPLRFFRSDDRPFLSDAERLALNQAHMYHGYSSFEPVVIRTSVRPIQYRAKQDVMYLIHLRRSFDIHSKEWVSGKLQVREESVHYATRREAIRRCVSVSTVPDWDMGISTHGLSRALLLTR